MSELVFVYGTLKSGFVNHSVMKKAGGLYIDDGYTKKEALMWNMGAFPGICFDYPNGEPAVNIHGEVYDVDDMLPLDHLEGYPSFYNRDQVEIETSAGTLVAWVYHLPHSLVDYSRLILSGEWI